MAVVMLWPLTAVGRSELSVSEVPLHLSECRVVHFKGLWLLKHLNHSDWSNDGLDVSQLFHEHIKRSYYRHTTFYVYVEFGYWISSVFVSLIFGHLSYINKWPGLKIKLYSIILPIILHYMFITEQDFCVFRALGVTLWELFESGKQPYPHLSDREVLHHVLKDQQVRLLKPQLDLPYSERWLVLHRFINKIGFSLETS